MDRGREWFLLRSMRALGPLRVERVALPGTAVTLEVTRPAPEGSTPSYFPPVWTEIWPSGVVLAGMIAREPDRFAGRRVLEVGPGVGLCAISALRAGAELVVADRAPGALALCVLNARRLTGSTPETLQVNWRYPGPALFAAAGAGFAIVLAADILYRQEDVRPLVRLLERVVAPGGEVWLAEPGRPPAARLVAVLRQRGWAGDSEACLSPWPDPEGGATGVVTVHRLRRSGASPRPVRGRGQPVRG